MDNKIEAQCVDSNKKDQMIKSFKEQGFYLIDIHYSEGLYNMIFENEKTASKKDVIG